MQLFIAYTNENISKIYLKIYNPAKLINIIKMMKATKIVQNSRINK